MISGVIRSGARLNAPGMSYRDGVQDPIPVLGETVEPSAYRLLSTGTDSEGSLIGLHVQSPLEERPHLRLSLHVGQERLGR